MPAPHWSLICYIRWYKCSIIEGDVAHGRQAHTAAEIQQAALMPGRVTPPARQTIGKKGMGGRFSLTAPAEQLALRFDLDPASVPAVDARYNIAPSQPVPVVVARPDGRLVLEWMRWGFQP